MAGKCFCSSELGPHGGHRSQQRFCKMSLCQLQLYRDEKRREEPWKQIHLGRGFLGRCLCSAGGLQLAQTGKTLGINYANASKSASLNTRECRIFLTHQAELRTGPISKQNLHQSAVEGSQTALWHLLVEENIFPFYIIWKTDKLYGQELISKTS